MGIGRTRSIRDALGRILSDVGRSPVTGTHQLIGTPPTLVDTEKNLKTTKGLSCENLKNTSSSMPELTACPQFLPMVTLIASGASSLPQRTVTACRPFLHVDSNCRKIGLACQWQGK